MPKLIDVFIFYDELDLLEFRLEYLDEIVDYFVIVDANLTFQGKEKPFYYEENKKRFAKYNHKIMNYKVLQRNIPFDTMPAMEREISQKKEIENAILDCNDILGDDDFYIMVSDIDEIPKKETVRKLIAEKTGPVNLEQRLGYYFMNCVSDQPWFGTTLFHFYDLSEDWYLRHNRQLSPVPNGGWHFSFLGGIEKIKSKIRAYGHSEYNNDYWLNDKKLLEHINKGEDLFERHYTYKFIPLDETLPHTLLEKPNKYRKFIYDISDNTNL